MSQKILMHMNDGLISVHIGFIFVTIAVLMMAISIKKVTESKDESKIPMMAVMGAFVFAGQMINFTIPGTGSSGHIGGGILLCLVLGQYPAFLSLCSVLIIQCLFFGDGGLLALGCNIFNMGVIPCFIAYPLIVKPILKKIVNVKSLVIASILGVVVGLELGAFGVVLETLASHITQLPFTGFVALMLPIHLAIGLVEGIITALVAIYVYKDNPAIIKTALTKQTYQGLNIKRQFVILGVFALLIGGGLSLYASSHPDGLEWSIFNVTGQEEIENTNDTKDEIASIQESTTVLPDYNFKDENSMLGTSFSGIVGIGLTFILAGATGFIISRKKHEKNN